MSAAKKKREREALLLVFDGASLFSVTAGESPDFVLKSTEQSPAFGVEVTEIHTSGSSARVTHLPGYGVELINGGPVRHKSDVDDLKVENVEFRNPDGSKVVGKAFAFPQPSLAEYRSKLADTIARKSAKAARYDDSLSHTNLIIVDHTHFLVGTKPEMCGAVLFDEGVRSATFNAVYNEIYLVTRLSGEKEGPPQQSYLPLRSMLLVTTMFEFSSVVKKSKPDARIRTWNQLSIALSDYLVATGVQACLRRTEAGNEILLGTLGLRIADDGHVFLNDYIVPPSVDPVEYTAPSNAPWRRPEFATALSDYRSKQYWKLSAAHPARRSSANGGGEVT